MTWRWRSAIPFARSQATGCWGPWWLLYEGEIWWLWGTRWPWITPLCTTQGSQQSKPIRQMRWWPTAQTGKTLWPANAAEGTKSQQVFAVWTKHGFHTLLLSQKKYVVFSLGFPFLGRTLTIQKLPRPMSRTSARNWARDDLELLIGDWPLIWGRKVTDMKTKYKYKKLQKQNTDVRNTKYLLINRLAGLSH